MKAGELLLSLVEWVDEVNSRTSDPVEVVVEGPKDERALRLLGIRANFTYASNLLAEIRDEGWARVRGRTFIIMTDFDEEGVKIHNKLKECITSYGGSVDESVRAEYRRRGFPLLIEELEGFLERRFPDWDMIRGSR